MTAAGKDYGDDLMHLIAKFSEDFSLEYSSEREAVDDFVEHSMGTVEGAVMALDRLLADASDDADLAAALNRMAFSYAAEDVGYASNRAFLLQLRGWLVESLAERPDTAED